MLSFQEAQATILQKLSAAKPSPASEVLPLDRAHGRILAEDVAADRDYPPFHRSTRDGYAVRSADLAKIPSTLNCLGEVRAGEHFRGTVGPGECVEIMTGAPLPAGVDAVVMLEHVHADGRAVRVERQVAQHENVVQQGSEAAARALVLRRGRQLGAGEMGLLASVGKAQVRAYLKPQVAVLPTGDEIVPIECQPKWFQIRNSNALALSAQVAEAGGIPRRLPIAPDRKDAVRELVEEGFESELLLISGGVSTGKYDFVRQVLRELDSEFFIEGVAIRPGKPLVFGEVHGKFFFGLPGNPVSTYVTFELFVRPAISLLGGAEFDPPVFLRARLAVPYRHNLSLTAFLPACVSIRGGDPAVRLVGWQGSGDLVGVAAANCLLVIHSGQTDLAEGDWVDVLPIKQ